MSDPQSPVEPMEALLVSELPDEAGWQYEPKWDGFRCIAVKQGDAVHLFAKSGKILHRYFPEMVDALLAVKANDFVLDGEIVVPEGNTLSFDAIQARLHPAESRIRKLAKETPARLILFDLLRADGKDLASLPLAQRREALEDFFAANSSPSLRLSPQTLSHKDAQHWLDNAGGSLDGVVAKRRDDPYRPGERAMLKVKNIRTADCVVGGFRYATNSKLLGSLLLGLYDDAGLLHHVGFTSALANEDKPALTAKLESLRGEGFTGNAPGGPSRWSTERSAEWVALRPELVVEVSYDHFTGDRFRHGTGLKRWRPDKAPRQCTFEQIAPPGHPAPVIAKVLAD
ncbi:MAG TPA: ATP-dependent DNA ligase [Devosia sp.]|nr:ATP-dependent DNA ligase [Devosia sp.]